MKFTCNLLAPITAIHEADTDGNEIIGRHAIQTGVRCSTLPRFQLATSGHSTFSGAAAEVLALFFGRDAMGF